MKHFLFVLTALALVRTTEARAFSYDVPMISVACHSEPYSYRRANGYDCTQRNAVKKGRVTVESSMSDLERTFVVNRAFTRLSMQAEADCGASCRFFYGVRGHQCLAVAQSRYYTGLGSFLGRETTQADSEATALRDCRDYVGAPGTDCTIIISECSTR